MIAKSKLYRNIFVYRSTQLGPRVAPTGNWGPEFKIRKTINNKKSVLYTIISTNTLEKYLASMDGDQKIACFEILDCNFTLLECVVRHFQFILYFEIIQRRFCCRLFNWELLDYFQLYMDFIKPKTFFYPNPHRHTRFHGLVDEDFILKLSLRFEELDDG